MKKLFILLFLLNFNLLFSQKKSIDLGRIKLDELKMTTYKKDSSANAVILEEIGYTYFNTKGINNYTKEYYVRIKILKNSGLKKATIEIPFYKKSRLKNIEAISYNLSDSGEVQKTFLQNRDIFKDKYSKNIRVYSFAIPNVKVGSVIEYKYSYSRNGYGIYDWNFQSDIPKIKTIYKASLSLRSNLQVRLIGFLKPSFENAQLKKKCIGVYKCSSLHYEMNHVPAFKEEKYLTSKKNYLSRLSFEEKYHNAFVDKDKDKQWGALDKAFKDVFKHKLNLSSAYKRKMPSSLFNEKNELKKVKQIYKFIQNRFTKDYDSKLRFEDVYEKKRGTEGQINLALYNALIAAKTKANLIFLSTRRNGFVTKLHGTLEDFNYRIVKVNINDKEYFLDASDKNLSFGLLPFKTLNGDGRVLDFKKGSYWQNITQTIKAKENIKTTLSLIENKIIGELTIEKTGYKAKLKRDALSNINEDDYIENFESDHPNIDVLNYSNENLNNLELPFKETFKISLDLEDNKKIKLNPFFTKKLPTNPFKLKERKYPVDYGYKRFNRYLFSFVVPKEYKIKSIPNSSALKLPNNGGVIILSVIKKENTITLLFKFNITRKTFHPSEYIHLKEFYNQIIKLQDTYIEIEKK